jgi:2-oxoisovalerate dehydrogenase E1 component
VPGAAASSRLAPGELLGLHRDMALLRAYDEQAVAYHRQGRLGTYPINWGHEAIQAGALRALAKPDWVFPSYRESAVGLLRGMPIETVLAYWRGEPAGLWNPYEHRVASVGIPVGSHVPHAVGFAWGSRMKGEDACALVFFGDGATSTGAFHEALTFAGVVAAPVVLLCNNNGWAISTPVSAQTAAEKLSDKAIGYGIPAARVDGGDVLAVYDATRAAVERARAGEGPTFVEAVTQRMAAHATADEPALYRDEERVEAERRNECLVRHERRLRDLGLLSEAEAEQVRRSCGEQVRAAMAAVEQRPPASSTVMFDTAFAEPKTSVRHDPTAARETEGAPVKTLVEAVNEALHGELERDPSVFVMGEDVGVLGGVFRATSGLLKRFPGRCFDTPVAEAGILGTAVGLALAGWRPVCEIQFDAFGYPALDQLIAHVGRYRARSGGAAEMSIVIRMPYGGGVRAPELHQDSPEAHYAHTAGVKVAIPATPADAKGLLSAAIRDPDPVVVLEPKRLYRAPRGEVPEGDWVVPLGKARIAAPGDDITLIAYGAMVGVALEARAELLAEGTSAEVVDLRTLTPLDEEAILDSVAKTGRAVVIQEAPLTCGFAAEVAAVLAERAHSDLRGPVKRVAGFDVPYPCFSLEDAYLPSAQRVVAAVREIELG